VLTRPLVRARVVRSDIVPQLVDPHAERVVEAAQAVLTEVHGQIAEGGTRGDIDEALADLCSERPDHKLVQGIAKICLDRTTFAAEPPLPPAELRREVFLEARSLGPLALEHGPLGRPVADDVLQCVADRHGLTVEAIREGLYADLRQNHRVLSCRLSDPTELVQRYNMALAQSVLLQASEVRVRLPEPTVPKIRQLLRWARFHQLIVAAQRDKKALELTLDGPTSLFRQSTRYGKNLALFLPALALQPRWELEATILWTKRQHRKTLRLDHDSGLVSHYRDTGAYKTKEQTFFEERFAALDTPWKLRDGQTLLPLGRKRFVFPDYTLVNGTRKVHLQLVGFWRKDTLAAHLEAVSAHAPDNLLVAVSKRLAGDKGAVVPDQVLAFTEILDPKRVIAAAEAAGG